MKSHLYKHRRSDVMQLMTDGVAIIPTAPERTRNRDVLYAYRPDSDFYYLTGFTEPEAVAVLIPGREQGEFVMFCRQRDPERESWDGARAGLDGVCEQYGADDAFPIEDLGDILPAMLENRHKVFYNVGHYPDFDLQIMGWVGDIKAKSRAGIVAPTELVDLSHIIHEQRLIKSTEEAKLMLQAARIAARGHRQAMRACKPGMMEYEIQAELEYEFKKSGSGYPAYPSIVAGGANACTLHYIENNQVLNSGDMLLIDAGAEFEGYASDITRTYPVNGRFTDQQRAVYEIVLAAQYAAIEQAKVGNHWNQPHDAAVRVITEGLIDIGLLTGTVDNLIADESYKRFYMHRTGHWLGMDVHDVGDYKIDDEWRVLEAGMVFTVEPGIYIPANDDIPPSFRHIGIRIEDDVLLHRNGHTVLSDAAPKTADDIEQLMAS